MTKSFVEQVRGVESGQVVNNLVEKGLVEEAGRLAVPGRPITYRTTPVFLRSFGLSGLGDLPQVPGREDSPGQDEVSSHGEDLSDFPDDNSVGFQPEE